MTNAKNRPNRSKEAKPKKDEDFRTPKRAFDQVMAAYPENLLQGSLLDNEASRQYSRLKIAAERDLCVAFFNELPPKEKGKSAKGLAEKGTAVRNPTAPTLLDLKCDADAQIKKIIHNADHIVKFIRRYLLGEEECLTRDEQHLFARYEQQIGKLFIRFHIWPVSKYLICIREKR